MLNKEQTTFKVGDRVIDWEGNMGIVESSRWMKSSCPCSAHAIKPYQRIKVKYPEISEWKFTEGATYNFTLVK